MRCYFVRLGRDLSIYAREMSAKRRAPQRASEGLVRSPVFSGGGGFRDGGGDLAKGAVDMIRMDGGGTTAGGTEPGGLGQEVESAWGALAGFGRHIPTIICDLSGICESKREVNLLGSVGVLRDNAEF